MIKFSEIPGGDKDREKKKRPLKDKKVFKDFSKINFSSLEETPVKKEEPQPPPPPIKDKKVFKDFSKINFSSLEETPEKKEELRPLSPVQTKDLYQTAVILAEKIFNSEVEISAADIEEIQGLVEKLVDCVRSGNQELLEHVFSPEPPISAHYISLNLVNACILSLEIGTGLGYDYSQLLKLGMAAFLHDIGMSMVKELVDEPRKLTPQEVLDVQRHPSIGAETLKNIKNSLEPIVFESVEQEHERMDSSGYPNGLDADQINEYAQIIGMVDVYEALTHPRPYHNSYCPFEAIKMVVGSKIKFSNKILRAFLERVGLYPPGILVELNTKERARIIKLNPKQPYCPVVRVICDSEGKELSEPREIDLGVNPTIYIKGPLEKESEEGKEELKKSLA